MPVSGYSAADLSKGNIGCAIATLLRWPTLVPIGRSLVGLSGALFLVPVVGVLASIASGDRPGSLELAGMATLLIGIAVVTLGSLHSAPRIPEAEPA